MHGIDIGAAPRGSARITTIDRKMALKFLGGGLSLLVGAPRLRPIAVNAEHDGT